MVTKMKIGPPIDMLQLYHVTHLKLNYMHIKIISYGVRIHGVVTINIL